jgi:starch-binding outer membrane protein, SusD/RagB family
MNAFMKKKLIFLIIAFMAINIQSCNDFLDKGLVSDVSGEYNSTASGWEYAVNATYYYLKYVYSNERAYSLTVFGTDTYTNGADGGYKGFNQYDANLRADIDMVQQMWEYLYKGVNQANAVIGRADELLDYDAIHGYDPKNIPIRVGEAKFLRALYLFNIVRQWGSAPMPLEETTAITLSAEKKSENEIYAQIIADCTDAMAALPAVQAQYGRATKGAAQNLRGMALLTRAWLNNTNADFVSAEADFTAVINSGTYSLVANHATLWDQSKQKNSEIIFAVQNSTDILLNSGGDGVAPGEGNRGHLYFLMQYDNQPGMVRDIANGRPFKRFRPTAYLLDLWGSSRDIDNRYDQTYKQAWISNGNNAAKDFPWTQAYIDAGAKKKDGTPVIPSDLGTARLTTGDTAVFIPGPGRETKWTAAKKAATRYQVILRTDAGTQNYNQFQYAHIKKFMDPLRPTTQWQEGSRDWFVMRLGDTYLLRAEARLMQSNAAGARADIVTIRQRAAFPGVDMDAGINPFDGSPNTPAVITLDYLLDERAREMDAEQERWYTLVRTKTLVQRVTLYNKDLIGPIDEHYTRRPFPQTQIDRTEGGAFTQNCGYPGAAACN